MHLRPSKTPLNQLQWVAVPGTAPLATLWAGRLRLTQPWAGVLSYSAESALFFLHGLADIVLTSPSGAPLQQFTAIGVQEYGPPPLFSPYSDVVVLPPGQRLIITPTACHQVDILVFAAFIPLSQQSHPIEGGVVYSHSITLWRHSLLHTARVYPLEQAGAKRLRIGIVENADRHTAYPFHASQDRYEEVRYYIVAPPDGEAVQRLKGKYAAVGQEVDTAVVVRSGDWCVLPSGDNPVLRIADHSLCYIWADVQHEPVSLPEEGEEQTWP